MILVFDTETTGVPLDGLPDEHPSQPHLVQLGVALHMDEGKEVSSASLIVQPDGWTIPDGAVKAHGITTAMANTFGIPLPVVLGVYFNLRRIVQEVVAYNIDFDLRIMRIAALRNGKKPSHPGPDKMTCVMRKVTPIIALPPTEKMKAAGFTKNKPPKLGQAYQHFFKEELVGAHDALIDARATARLFFHLRGQP